MGRHSRADRIQPELISSAGHADKSVGETQVIRPVGAGVSESPTQRIPRVTAAEGIGDGSDPPAVQASSSGGGPDKPIGAVHDRALADLVGGSASATADPGETQADEPTGAQHTQAGPRRHNSIFMWIAVIAFWLAALPVGVACAVAAGARRASLCSKSSSSLGCTTAGSTLAVVMLVVTVAMVGTVSIFAFDARNHPRRWLAVCGAGVLSLALLGLGAWLLIRTIR